MPPPITYLTKRQISVIRGRIQKEGVKTSELLEDLLDHFCVAVEEEMMQGRSFDSAFNRVFSALQENELKTTEMKTQELLEGKKIFYPDLGQSHLSLLVFVLIGGIAYLTILAIAYGEPDNELRAQWLDQYRLIHFEIAILLAYGGAIGYAVREIRRTQVNAPVFSFRPVPAYGYAVIILIAVLSQFWLEPLRLWQAPPAIAEQLGTSSPEVVGLVLVINVILFELLFRGIILKGLLMTTTPIRAILWSTWLGSIFGMTFFFFYFLVGLMQGWLYWKTRSLYASMLLLLTSIISGYFIALFLSPLDRTSFSWWEYLDKNVVLYIPLVIGSLLLTVALLYYLHRSLSTDSSE